MTGFGDIGGIGNCGDAGIGDCGEAMHRLYHYLDGELDDIRRADIRSHLDNCLPCLDAFDFETELRAVIARKCRERVPDELRARIAVALQHEFKAADDPSPDGITEL
ncbi:MAG TPA: mycothiol system anti-sigma-R factor [Acidimicrobiales bacterium]|nr:mycothiol system anti-sigma-R factor [Acidimicrobiales bacterium]